MRARSAARRTITSNQSRKQSHAALRHHIAATVRRGTATHTQQHKSAIAILRYSPLVNALETPPQCTPKTPITHRAYDTATILAGPTRISRTCRRHAPRHHYTTYTRAPIHPMRQAQPSTTARQCHGACHPKQLTPACYAPHIAHSHTAHKHTGPARPEDVTRGRDHGTVRKQHCTHTAARTPHATRHTVAQLCAPHTQPTENHTK
jgi:hypothetical protein